MKRIRSVLRGREGMTLVELIVSAGLLCLVIAVFSASLRPAAEISRRTQELNSAELIADDLLETVRSRVETATEYIKCYENGADITNRTGSSRGSAVEFGTANAVELLTADGCAETAIMVGSGLGAKRGILFKNATAIETSARIDTVVFDRGGNKYHGRVAAVADGAREGGLTL